MIGEEMTPRIDPVKIEELDGDGQALLLSIDNQGTGADNVFRTLVRNKGLFRYFILYGGKLLKGKLPPRLRELLILRIAHLCESPYEWNQHVKIATSVGLNPAEIEAIRLDTKVWNWSDIELAVLNAVDQLHLTANIQSDVWQVLTQHLDEAQLVELPLLVGHFHGVAYFLNALEIEIENEVVPFNPVSSAT